MASAGSPPPIAGKRRVLMIVQNLPVPFDRRVWQMARELAQNGYVVSVICPKGRGFDASHEVLDGVHIYRHPLPFEAKYARGYPLEYACSLAWEFALAWKVFFARGFDAIHACNPPDTIFLIGGFFKLFFGKKFCFDHHDLNPELYEAKFRRKGWVYRLLLLCERLTFAAADISIATNESYRRIAMERGKMPPRDIFVVRSGPSLERLRIIPPVPEWKKGRRFLVGYVGVMGQQEGIAYLIQAVRYLVHEKGRADIHFALVGSGPMLGEMQALARAEGVADYMTFAGPLPDAQLLEVLNTADICVNPDEANVMNDKSTMNKIMEYMALGKPVVQFDLTEGRVSAADASLYARPNDARDLADNITALLDNPERCEAMGKSGRARARNVLAWPHEAPKLLAAYDALFGQANPSKLAWYYYRLRAMPPREIICRIQEAGRKIRDRFLPRSPAAYHRGRLLPLPGLWDGLAQWQLPQSMSSKWRQQYAQARSGHFFLLGRRWPEHPQASRWHLDPVTGTCWPQDRYCFAIDYRRAADKGDIKYVWELNRLHYLQPLAALAFKQKDPALAAFCVSEIEDWIAHNPPRLGVNWASGIELALRAVSVLVVATLTENTMSKAQRAAILAMLEDHGHWLERYPSRFSSANNHRVAEGLGLLAIGALCPQLKQAERWKAKGWKILCDTIEILILPDGTGAEQAISYAAFTRDMFMLGQHIALACGLDIPQPYMERLAQAENFLRGFTDAGGNYPRIGDDDEGRLLDKGIRLALWGVPEKSAERLGVHTFRDGGYTIGRHILHDRLVLLAMDHGPLGFEPLAAHGHADALSLWLHIGDQPVLVDSGTFLYHSGGDWRAYFRSTAAHNTLCVENAGASIAQGNFNWSHKARARLNASGSDKESWWIEAEHDGYRKAFGAVHRRKLIVTPSTGFIVEDTLIAPRKLNVEIMFHLHPALSAAMHGNEAHIFNPERLILRLRCNGSLLLQARQDGWYSPAFGEKVPMTRMVLSGALAPGEKSVAVFSFA